MAKQISVYHFDEVFFCTFCTAAGMNYFVLRIDKFDSLSRTNCMIIIMFHIIACVCVLPRLPTCVQAEQYVTQCRPRRSAEPSDAAEGLQLPLPRAEARGHCRLGGLRATRLEKPSEPAQTLHTQCESDIENTTI